jgi:hypothetical protein
MNEIHNTDPRKNAEGYPDPTAYEAIKRIEYSDPEATHFYRVIGCIRRIVELSGYTLEEKVVLRDVRTGKIWR